MVFRTISTFVLSLCAGILGTIATAQPITEDALIEHLKTIQSDGKLVAAGALIQTGNVVTTAAIGERKHDSGISVTTNDLWHMGSIGKSITATMIARLVESGDLEWNTPLPALLPSLADEMDPGWSTVTLHHLLSHTSGMQANPSTATLRERETDPAKLMELRNALARKLLRKPPSTEPSTHFQYSNAGYAIVGAIAEQATGKPWEKLVLTEVAAPLGMTSLGFQAPMGDGPTDQPWGHSKIFGFKTPRNPANGADNPQLIGPAGTMHMTMPDLAKYVSTHMRRGRDNPKFLSTLTFDRLHTPVLNDYAYGWVKMDREWADGEFYWHNGSNTMWYALMIAIPSKDTVMIFVTNDGDTAAAENRFFALAAKIAPTIPSVTETP